MTHANGKGDGPAPFWAEWEAQPGYVALPDGRRVLVRGGDELLVQENEDGSVTCLAHRPATRH